jgi:hypothetical protein
MALPATSDVELKEAKMRSRFFTLGGSVIALGSLIASAWYSLLKREYGQATFWMAWACYGYLMSWRNEQKEP